MNRLLVAFVMGLLLPSVALAECERFTEMEMKALVLQGQDALDEDDIEGYGEIQKTMEASLACLEEPVDTYLWATFLVGLSVVEYYSSGKWEQPLSTAIRIQPDIERDFGPEAVQRYFVGTPPDGDAVLPGDAKFYVDGIEVTTEQSLGGLHVVQRNQAGVWDSRVIRAGTWPGDWRVVEVANPGHWGRSSSEVRFWGSFSAIAGFGQANQSALDPNEFFPEVGHGGIVAGVSSYGSVGLGTTVGVFWDASFPLNVDAGAAADAFAGISFQLGPLSLWPGVGGMMVAATEGDVASRFFLLQPHLGVRAAFPISDGIFLDVGGAGGGTVAGSHLSARAAVGTAEDGGVGWFLGPQFNFMSSQFVEDGGENEVSVGRWRVALMAGLAFGG